MKAAVFYEPKDIRIENVDEPTPASDELLIEVSACGFCGSDVEYYTGKTPVATADGKGPLILGHEFSGRVVGIGSGVNPDLISEGDRVAVNPIQSCNACDGCRSGRPQLCSNVGVLGVSHNGGFAEFATTKAVHAYKIPDALSDGQGAFVEMLSAAVNAAAKADVQPGQLAVIYGPGAVGLSLVQLLKNKGAQVVLVGTRDYRLDLGKKLGADQVYNVSDSDSPHYAEDLKTALTDHNGGRLADRVIVATGSMDANQEALEISGPGSLIVYMAVTGPEDAVSLPLFDNLVADKTIRFSLWYPNQWPTTLRVLDQSIVHTDDIITHEAALGSIDEAIERVMNRDDSVVKTIIRPS